jgi:hypothetical protein
MLQAITENALDFIEDHLRWFVGGLLLAMAIGLGYAIWYDEREWQRFAAENDCVKVGVIRGDVLVSTGLSSDGKVVTTTTTTPTKTGYRCKDGITYWR